MEIPVKSNTQYSPYILLGNGMIWYGICWIIITGINFACRWILYMDVYSEGYDASLLNVAIMLSLISLLFITVAEMIVIITLRKTAHNTHISVFNHLVIIHGVYVIYVIVYPFVLPFLLNIFYASPVIKILNTIYSIAGYLTILILLLSDLILYLLCTKVLRQYPLKHGYIIYLPFLIMFFRLMSFVMGLLSKSYTLSLTFTVLYVIIPIIWIVLGKNFKIIAPISENAIGYSVEEPRLDYHTPQVVQKGNAFNPLYSTPKSNSYGTCLRCGKPRISPSENFCSNCGNRF